MATSLESQNHDNHNIPVNINSFSEGLRKSAEVFHCLKSIIDDKGLSTSVGDEGGFAPNLNSESDALDIISMAIKKAKYKLVDDFVFALDVASTEFFTKNKYTLTSEKKSLSSDQFISYLKIHVKLSYYKGKSEIKNPFQLCQSRKLKIREF